MSLNPRAAKPGLTVHSEQPFNAEPPLERLRSAFVTPVGDFYVRSHGAIPALDPATYRLGLGGMVARPLRLGLGELRERFAAHDVAAVMQCAGNRRADMQPVRATSGDPWAPGAIGNAVWTGARLADLLDAAGVDAGAGHVAFDAADECDAGQGPFRFGVSIPLAKARAPEVILAWAMNGEPLTPPHGAPLRAVVPGYAGVRSAKWLTGIELRAQPSDNPMQATDYKLLPPDVTAETVDWARGMTIYDMPLNAAICEPAAEARLPPGRTLVRGYALASGRAIVRVDLSADGGQSWEQAVLEEHGEAPWSWTFWRGAIDLPAGRRELVARAWDSAGQTQPARAADVWNFKGYLCAAWHRVPVSVG